MNPFTTWHTFRLRRLNDKIARNTPAADAWRDAYYAAIGKGFTVGHLTSIRQHARTGEKAYVRVLDGSSSVEAVWFHHAWPALGSILAFRGGSCPAEASHHDEDFIFVGQENWYAINGALYAAWCRQHQLLTRRQDSAPAGNRGRRRSDVT
jgi:hypothetical protein